MRTLIPITAALAILLAASIAPAQPQGTAPKDPQVQPPMGDDLESLWRQIDCECDCECCEHIKALIKQRIKDPHRRPQLGARGREARKWKRHPLDLTDEQRTQMRDIRYQWKMKRIDLEAKLDKAELEFKHLMRAGDMDEKEIRARVNAIASMRADLEFNRIMSRLESRQVLTDEQRKDFQWDRPKEMKKKRRR